METLPQEIAYMGLNISNVSDEVTMEVFVFLQTTQRYNLQGEVTLVD